MAEGDVVRLEACASCGHGIDIDAAFCSACGKRVRLPSPSTDVRAALVEFATGAVDEARDLGVEALKSDTGKKIAAGAALGATAGAVLPLIGPVIGATLGAGYVAFKRLTR